jgi:hypothetical protein
MEASVTARVDTPQPPPSSYHRSNWHEVETLACLCCKTALNIVLDFLLALRPWAHAAAATLGCATSIYLDDHYLLPALRQAFPTTLQLTLMSNTFNLADTFAVLLALYILLTFAIYIYGIFKHTTVRRHRTRSHNPSALNRIVTFIRSRQRTNDTENNVP